MMKFGFLNATSRTRLFTTFTVIEFPASLPDGPTKNDSSRLVVGNIARFPHGAYNFQELRDQGSHFSTTHDKYVYSPTQLPV
jgi:hypothetical protein